MLIILLFLKFYEYRRHSNFTHLFLKGIIFLNKSSSTMSPSMSHLRWMGFNFVLSLWRMEYFTWLILRQKSICLGVTVVYSMNWLRKVVALRCLTTWIPRRVVSFKEAVFRRCWGFYKIRLAHLARFAIFNVGGSVGSAALAESGWYTTFSSAVARLANEPSDFHSVYCVKVIQWNINLSIIPNRCKLLGLKLQMFYKIINILIWFFLRSESL